jgi:hypothetical protein
MHRAAQSSAAADASPCTWQWHREHGTHRPPGGHRDADRAVAGIDAAQERPAVYAPVTGGRSVFRSATGSRSGRLLYLSCHPGCLHECGYILESAGAQACSRTPRTSSRWLC